MANFIVTNTNDSGNGSLRQAIQQANQTKGADTISFKSGLKGRGIALTSGQLRLSSAVTIDGDINNDGIADITISSNSDSRVFLVQDNNKQADKAVRLEGLIIRGGEVNASGAGVFNTEKLTLVNSAIRDFDSDGSYNGLGVYNSGAATIVNTTISGLNPYSGDGIGIFNKGSLTLTGGSITRNSTYSTAPAVFNSGRATIQGTRIANNNSANGSGAISNSGQIVIADSVITQNTGSFGSGGALANLRGGKAVVRNTTISRNSAAYSGGGINNDGRLTVTRSTIARNSTSGSGFAGDYGSSGGGIFNSGFALVENTTITQNTATGGSGYDVQGGGVYNSGQFTARSSTISGNRATGGVTRGGGLFTEGNSTVNLFSTIIGDNTAQQLADVARTGSSSVNATNSLIENGSNQVNGTNRNNIFNLDPRLDPAGLRNNGGPTQTIALRFGSPAIDAGLANGQPTDQRGTGFNRVLGGQADIGAFESSFSGGNTGGGNTGGGNNGGGNNGGAGNSPTMTFTVRAGSGVTTISNFDGLGRGNQPTAQSLESFDTIKFRGAGMTARNLRMRNNRGDVVITFDGVTNTQVTLKKAKLENIENVKNGIGNMIFNGQSKATDNFDAIDFSANPSRVFGKNQVTFLNDKSNRTSGYDASNDVINAQNGNDVISGLSGNDLLRGESGNDRVDGGHGQDIIQGGDGYDTLLGGTGNDTMSGGGNADVIKGGAGNDLIFGDEGLDTLTGGSGRDVFAFRGKNLTALKTDTVTDFAKGQDKIGLAKQTFSALTSSGGTLKASEFASVANDGLVDRNSALIVFSKASGKVFYNANGSETGSSLDRVNFAKLSGTSDLSATDFTLL